MDTTTANGIKPEVLAKKIAHAIEANRNEMFIAGGRERLALLLQRYFPGLLARIIRKAVVR
jgi:hypothetical protein